jgi:hypothetical protein
MAAAGVSVLAIDFTGIGASRSFGPLLSALPACRVRKHDPVCAHLIRQRTLAEHAAHVRDEIGEVPTVIFGYCSSALLAAAVAAEFRSSHGVEPAVILYDPLRVTADTLFEEFTALYESVGGDMTRVGPIADAGPDTVQRLETHLVEQRTHLVRSYGGGDSTRLVDDLLRRHQAWLRFLSASATSGSVALERATWVIAGQPQVELTPILDHHDRCRISRCDAPEGGLLVHPDALRQTRTVIAQLR